MNRRRDRSNELIVAIVVIGTLAVALTFGIILTLSSNVDSPGPKDTPTPVAQGFGSASPTFTTGKTAAPEASRTIIPTPGTWTRTPTPLVVRTSEPTSTVDSAATTDAIFALTLDALDIMLTQEIVALTASVEKTVLATNKRDHLGFAEATPHCPMLRA